MELSEFENGFMLLRGAYGERVFPKERETVLWNRFKSCAMGEFKTVVERIVLRMPQPHAVIDWLDDALRADTQSSPIGSAFSCGACRDHGFGFVGDTVVACSCASGRSIGPADLARHQAGYDRGRKLFPTPGHLRRTFGIEGSA